MQAFRIALSFIKIPRLFAYLILWPLLSGIGLALIQVIMSTVFIGLADENSKSFEKRINRQDTSNEWIQQFLFGESSKHSYECRWIDDNYAPTTGCTITPLDLVIRTDSPETADVSVISSLFKDIIPRIHVCRKCQSDLMIYINEEGKNKVELKSIFALFLYMNSESNQLKLISDLRVQGKKTLEDISNKLGTIYLMPKSYPYSINLSYASRSMILVTNTAFLVILTLWLSLVGHRKVLQYFSTNDALLPLVAGCGKTKFYNAIWLITLFRVMAFLFSTIPITILFYINTINDNTLTAFVKTPVQFILWIMAICTSLAAFSLLASIAELKHRHSFVSFLYKYIPALFCVLGSFIWFFSVFGEGEASSYVRIVFTSLPLFGLTPMILTPIFPVEDGIIATHALLASIMIVILMRINSRWFAAHLEEI